MPELQQTINAFNSAFPTRSAIETRAALTATLGQARALRKDARSTNAHLVSKFCQDTAEAMKVLAPDYYANACDVYLASAQEARDEFLDDLVESAKNVGETVTSGVKIAFPALALAVFAFLVLKD